MDKQPTLPHSAALGMKVTPLLKTELSEQEAMALAKFVKRLLLDDCKAKAVNEEEAYRMWDALEKVRQALAREGFAPR